MTEDHDRATAPGSALLDVVAVMDRLRSPGGCPWDAEQTHASLTRYLLEETYEVLDAVDALGTAGADGADGAGGAGADADLAEELGDVLLQVVFHARVAAERGAFDVDDVAAGLVAKLVRRHPHVFADEQGTVETSRTGAAVQARWDELKAAEKPGRGPLDGIPAHLPALAKADKLVGRLQRAGLRVDALAADACQVDQVTTTPEAVGDALFSLVVQARAAGVDAEAALRSHLARVTAEALSEADARERTAAATGTDRTH